MRFTCIAAFLTITLPCLAGEPVKFNDVVSKIADGWRGEIVSEVDQSYPGWDVEIGDADNDGKNEILTTGCPDSRLYLFKKVPGGWITNLLAENMARERPGMGLAVKVVDLNKDGKNEIIVGTGQEKPGTAHFHIFQTDGQRITRHAEIQPSDCLKSGYTHDLAAYDLNGDGVLEVLSAYCGHGEVIRYTVDKNLINISARKVHQLSGSGEEALIADVDNDGKVEFLTCNGFRDEKARVEIFEFDDKGELAESPRVIIDGFKDQKCFYCSIVVGDVDNDGKNELIVGWKKDQKVNKTTLIGYRIPAGDGQAKPVYIFDEETEDLDLGYFEKMMAIADVDGDGKNELVLSTRGDEMSEHITSKHLGNVFMYNVDSAGKTHRELIAKLNLDRAESSWLAVGDADNDAKPDIVLATGKGNREKTGTGYILLLTKK